MSRVSLTERQQSMASTIAGLKALDNALGIFDEPRWGHGTAILAHQVRTAISYVSGNLRKQVLEQLGVE